MAERKVYTEEQKAEILKKAEETNVSTAAKEFGVSRAAIIKWRDSAKVEKAEKKVKAKADKVKKNVKSAAKKAEKKAEAVKTRTRAKKAPKTEV
ncbi:MAG: transposase, partial [Clostridia bacterium]|nr:transposase [Clostridia bacterium]